jgi:hypothetical protein
MKATLHRNFLGEKSFFYHRFIGTSAPRRLAQANWRVTSYRPTPRLLYNAQRKARKGADMAVIQRKFYQSSRGPAPADEDSWCLVFDAETRRLLVRHEWQASGHSGFDELEVAEFLEQTGGAQTALIDSLFLVPADA